MIFSNSSIVFSIVPSNFRISDFIIFYKCFIGSKSRSWKDYSNILILFVLKNPVSNIFGIIILLQDKIPFDSSNMNLFISHFKMFILDLSCKIEILLFQNFLFLLWKRNFSLSFLVRIRFRVLEIFSILRYTFLFRNEIN